MCLRVCVRVCVCVCILILHSVNMYCCCTYLGLLHLDRFGECDDHAVYCPSLSALYYLNKFKEKHSPSDWAIRRKVGVIAG